MLTPHSDSRLGGTPVRLAEVVATASTRQEQSERVQAYWYLTSAVADYYLGLAEVEEFGRLRQQMSTFSATLREEETKQAARVATALRAAQAAQMKLGGLIGRSNPLPADTPFCGPYRTRYDQLFTGEQRPEAALLDSLLPLRLAELHAAADAIDRSNAWIDRVKRDGGGSDGSGLVRALELVALNRRAFVQLARDYNLQINRYTELVAPDRVDTPRLVAMLIRTPQGSAPRGGADPMVAGFSAGGANSASRSLQPGSSRR
ncbi:hypothetical protein [Botrimarina sp.]|uniref:hypothetical protein n=1 Tax=Botrimarina sp. TaxID=2795802 RepID=UPI0032EF39C2